MIVAARQQVVNDGLVGPKVARFFRNIEAYGNPYRELRQNRGRWARDMGIEPYSGQEFLFYVGCVGSFDEKVQKTAQAVGRLFLKAGLSFGILGPEEDCDGNEVHILGESRLFGTLRERNTILFQKAGVKKIIALSPHAYNVFRKEYPAGFQVFHYTQVLRDLIKAEELKPASKLNVKVTYHDPCFLGRHANEYEAPREILGAIDGVELVEMGRNRQNSFCCGGGSGNFYTDFFGGGPTSPSRIRIREAHDTGATVLAVACPTCTVMLGEAIKDEALEESMLLKDISQVLEDAVFSEVLRRPEPA
ncbi:MAG: (Fe-S)-binding protein [Dehalococcoidia bacterium]